MSAIVVQIYDFDLSNHDRIIETAKNIMKWDQVQLINRDRTFPQIACKLLIQDQNKYDNEEWREYLYSVLTEANGGEPMKIKYHYFENGLSNWYYMGFDE